MGRVTVADRRIAVGIILRAIARPIDPYIRGAVLGRSVPGTDFQVEEVAGAAFHFHLEGFRFSGRARDFTYDSQLDAPVSRISGAEIKDIANLHAACLQVHAIGQTGRDS